MTSTQKTPKGRSPQVECWHEERSWLYWHQHGGLYGQNPYGWNALENKKPDSDDIDAEDIMVRLDPTGRTSHEENPWLLWR